LFVASFPFDATVHITSPSASHIRTSGSSGLVHLTSPPDLGSSGGPKGPPTGPGVSNQTVHEALHAQHSADLHTLLVWFAVALGIMAVASVFLGWLMGGRVLRPLRQITATTRHISEENLHERVALAGPSDEITDLANTIDGLLIRLEGAFDAQRAFVANVSHELRTPLAMMRTSLDVAAAKSPPISQDASVLSRKVYEGLDQAERLVESFLVLARVERAAVDDQTIVSLTEIVTETLDARADAASSTNVNLQRSLDTAEVVGSRILLSQLAANLIDNAIRYNELGGWVCVVTGVDEAGNTFLIVENSGPVLTPVEAGQLKEPFRRGGADRTGSDTGVGLGLSIAAAIARAHRGTVELQARQQGGLEVTVRLLGSVATRLERRTP
jgi:signal transduction histidine kinase